MAYPGIRSTVQVTIRWNNRVSFSQAAVNNEATQCFVTTAPDLQPLVQNLVNEEYAKEQHCYCQKFIVEQGGFGTFGAAPLINVVVLH